MRGFSGLIYEFTNDLVTSSAFPCLVRIPFYLTDLNSIIRELLNKIIAISISGTYIRIRSQFRENMHYIIRLLCRSSLLNDLIISMIKPWEYPIPLGLSNEISNGSELEKIFSCGFSFAELGLSLLLFKISKSSRKYFSKETIKPLEVSVIKEAKYFPLILRNLCNKCKGDYLCIKVCPEGKIIIGSDDFPYATNICTGCRLCTSICPCNAIKLAVQLELED